MFKASCFIVATIVATTAYGQNLMDEVSQAMVEALGSGQSDSMFALNLSEDQNHSVGDANHIMSHDDLDSHGLEDDSQMSEVMARLGSHGSHHELFGPAGVMGAHHHVKGEFMLSYRYMFMEMEGSRDGDSRISDADVRAGGFPVVPTDMTMQMHMLGAMYAPTDWVTVMLMVPYIRKDMDHIAGAPLGAVKFRTTSEGIGDIKLSGLFPLIEKESHHFQANVGLSLPSGSINSKDNTPLGRVELPYPMRLGSGTVDLLPGITYTHRGDGWTWGGQAAGTMRLGRNNSDYSLGDRFGGTAWATYDWNDSLSTSVRLNYEIWGTIDGADRDLNPALVPTADPNRRGGQRLDLLFGLDLAGQDDSLEGHRLGIEAGIPIYQKLDGPQLEVDWFLVARWQYRF